MKLVIALFLFSFTLAAQEVVFRGTPNLRVFATVEKDERQKLDGDTARQNECVVVRRGRKYFWASRNNVELTRVDAPQFTYFVHTGGAGYIKVLTGERKAMNAPADYIENINRGFEVITYWGRVSSDPG